MFYVRQLIVFLQNTSFTTPARFTRHTNFLFLLKPLSYSLVNVCGLTAFFLMPFDFAQLIWNSEQMRFKSCTHKLSLIETRNMRSSCFVFSQTVCAFCFLGTFAVYVDFHLWNTHADLCQIKGVRFDLVNILTEQKNVFHLSEFSAK